VVDRRYSSGGPEAGEGRAYAARAPLPLDLSKLRAEALAARRSGTLLSGRVGKILDGLEASSAPNDFIGRFLKCVAAGGAIPLVPDGLPDDMRSALRHTRSLALRPNRDPRILVARADRQRAA
jgi:hypothetical protein